MEFEYEGKKIITTSTPLIDKLSIKEWADKKDQELRKTIKSYIANGIEARQAVEIVLKSSTLGVGYNAQIRHDFK